MTSSALLLSPSAAARRLGISTKALRVYEQRGLVRPTRTATGWRIYGPEEMARAEQIASLRRLGLGLAEIGRALANDRSSFARVLAAHQATLQAQAHDLAQTIARVQELRTGLGGDKAKRRSTTPNVAFDLPWPWGGERFELHDIRALNFIIGPLGSGKTRFAKRLAETLPGAAFAGLDRAADEPADPAHAARIARTLDRLVGAGATESAALAALLAIIEADGPETLVVDMVEQGLDRATQEALIADLRRRPAGSRPLFLLTRSSSILDMAAMGPDEAIILCPANHSPPVPVAPHPGAPGYEAVATCLAPPHVRARTQGVIAWRPEVA